MQQTTCTLDVQAGTLARPTYRTIVNEQKMMHYSIQLTQCLSDEGKHRRERKARPTQSAPHQRPAPKTGSAKLDQQAAPRLPRSTLHSQLSLQLYITPFIQTRVSSRKRKFTHRQPSAARPRAPQPSLAPLSSQSKQRTNERTHVQFWAKEERRGRGGGGGGGGGWLTGLQGFIGDASAVLCVEQCSLRSAELG